MVEEIVGIFHDADGIIRLATLRADMLDEDIAARIADGETLVTSAVWPDTATQYVSEGALADRPAIVADPAYAIAADGEDAVSISVPAGTEIETYDGVTLTKDVAEADDTFVFTAIRAGRWTIYVTPPAPWQRTRMSVEAT
jgi:hypothetical protein